MKKSLQLEQLEKTKPDPVLGYNNNKDLDQAEESSSTLWDKSLLKSVILDKQQVWGETTKIVANEEGTIEQEDTMPYVPKHFNFGLTEEEAKAITQDLPIVSAMQPLLGQDLYNDQIVQARLEQSQLKEQDKQAKMMRIVDLRNADSKGIQLENTRRIIDAFKRAPNDTASPEVQAALLTAKIHNLKDHLKRQPRDVTNQRPLRTMIHQRSKILKYLRSLDVGRYEECLAKIGVEPRAVEGEVIVTKQALRSLIKEL